jgi:hypothetical protein
MKGWGLAGALINVVWLVIIKGVTSGWFVVCMGDEMENRLVVPHDEANGWWELQGSMRQDELGDIRRLVPMLGGLLRTHAPLSKNNLLLYDNFKSIKLITQY